MALSDGMPRMLHTCAFNQFSSQLLHHLPTGSPAERLQVICTSERCKRVQMRPLGWFSGWFSFRIQGREQTACSRRPGNDTLLRHAAKEAAGVPVFLFSLPKKKTVSWMEKLRVFLLKNLCCCLKRKLHTRANTGMITLCFSYNTNVLVDYESLRSHYSWEPAAESPSFPRNGGLRGRHV